MIPDGYDLEDQIRSTRSTQVWRAKKHSGEPVVLKLAAKDSRVESRFKREIDAMLAAAGPNVMPVLDFDDSYSWYSMPVALRTLYETPVPTSFEECLLVLEAVTRALNPIHSRGQVHRDLKPQNILWLEDEVGGRWVVSDFGIVRNPAGLTTEQLTRVGGLTGSEGWAAPEQHDDAHVSTITADVYGAGAILSWMLTGKRPSFGQVKPVDEPQLKAVLRRATNSDPAGRYSNLEDLLKAVTDSAVQRTTGLESLLEAGDWPQVSSYVSQSERLTRVVKLLPKLDQSQVSDWYKADSVGLTWATSESLDDLASDIRSLEFDAIDKFLSWGVIVLRVLVQESKYDAAERVATALFGATAGIDQNKPAKAILKWLSGLSQQAQQAMEAALHSSSSWDFFKQHAVDTWESRGESDLVQRLREE
ncbi:serine/threonine-protein kinase [Arthrobacter sp. 2RAF6]|uniref:serine/threonine-protein kinase n=1 Tax=Arthrobacter sp. 2RAF6 TaxID=3233002 RepID=UPI003F930C48